MLCLESCFNCGYFSSPLKPGRRESCETNEMPLVFLNDYFLAGTSKEQHHSHSELLLWLESSLCFQETKRSHLEISGEGHVGMESHSSPLEAVVSVKFFAHSKFDRSLSIDKEETHKN